MYPLLPQMLLPDAALVIINPDATGENETNKNTYISKPNTMQQVHRKGVKQFDP